MLTVKIYKKCNFFCVGRKAVRMLTEMNYYDRGNNYINRRFIICTLQLTLTECLKGAESICGGGGECSTGRRKKNSYKFFSGKYYGIAATWGGPCCKWVGHVAYMRDEKWMQNFRQRPFYRSRHTWEDNIKVDLKEIGSENMDWIHLAYDMVQLNTFVVIQMNFYIP
jgi:hypothetical protein